MSGFWEWNLTFLTVLAEHRTAFLDVFFAVVTFLGSEYMMIAAVCLLYLCIDKKLAYRLGMVFFASSALVQALKLTFRIERPWVLIERDFPHLANRYSTVEILGAKAGATGYSFPSGHTQSSVALYGTFLLRGNKAWMKILAGCAMVAVMFSRLYLGVHTPLDVGVSFILTTVFLVLGELVFEKIYENRKFDWAVSALVAGISLAAAGYALALYSTGKTDFDMVSDSLKGSACGVGFAVGYLVERRFIGFDPTVGTKFQKALRLVCGVGGVLILKEGVKYLGRLIFDGRDLPAVDFLRYMLIILFALCVLPAAVKKIHRKDGKNDGEGKIGESAKDDGNSEDSNNAEDAKDRRADRPDARIKRAWEGSKIRNEEKKKTYT